MYRSTSAAGFVAPVFSTLSRPRSAIVDPWRNGRVLPGHARVDLARGAGPAYRRQTTAAFANARSDAVVHSGGVGTVSSPHCTSGRVSKRWAPASSVAAARRRTPFGARGWQPLPTEQRAHCLPLSTASRHRKMVPAAVGEWLGTGATGTDRLVYRRTQSANRQQSPPLAPPRLETARGQLSARGRSMSRSTPGGVSMSAERR